MNPYFISLQEFNTLYLNLLCSDPPFQIRFCWKQLNPCTGKGYCLTSYTEHNGIPQLLPLSNITETQFFFSEGSCWILAVTIISASVVVGKIFIMFFQEEVRNAPDVTRSWANKRQDTLRPQVPNKYPQTAVAIIIPCKSRQNLIISISCIWKAL